MNYPYPKGIGVLRHSYKLHEHKTQKIFLMPSLPLKNCTKPGCPTLTAGGGRCPAHASKARRMFFREYDSHRPTSDKRGYDFNWYKVRRLKLSINPLCQMCQEDGRYVKADIVHHIQTIEEHPELRLTLTNLLSVCNYHHSMIHNRFNN